MMDRVVWRNLKRGLCYGLALTCLTAAGDSTFADTQPDPHSRFETKNRLANQHPAMVESEGQIKVMVVRQKAPGERERLYEILSGKVNVVYHKKYESQTVADIARTYTFDEKTQHETVAVEITQGSDHLRLASLELTDGKGKSVTLADTSKPEDVNGQQIVLSAVQESSKYGDTLRLVLTTSTGTAKLQELKKEDEIFKPVRVTFRSISLVFPDRNVIFTTQAEEALDKLKDISSASDSYYRELLDLAQSRSSVDLPHAQMLLKATYFTTDEFAQMGDDYLSLKLNQNEDFAAVLAKRLSEKSARAAALLHYNTQLVDILLPKIEGLDLKKALDFVDLNLPPLGYAESAKPSFDYLIKTFAGQDSSPQTSPETKTQIMNLAIKKEQLDIATQLASEIFNDSTKENYQDLAKYTSSFHPKEAEKIVDLVFLKQDVMKSWPAMTFNDCAALMGVIPETSTLKMAKFCMSSMSNMSKMSQTSFKVEDAALIAQYLSNTERDTFLEAAIEQVGDLAQNNQKLLDAQIARLQAHVFAQGEEDRIAALVKARLARTEGHQPLL